MERYEASRVGADTSCRYHRPSSTPSTATHSIIFANQYCVKLRVKASLTRIGQLDQQSCKLSLPYTSRPNYSFALFVVFRPHARDQKITMHRKYSIMKYSDSDSVLSLLHHYVYYLSCKNSPFVYKDFPWCSTCY